VVPPQTPDRERLSQIEADIRALPSVLAQLAYLAQLRDPNTGVYSYPTVTDRSRTQEAHRVLEQLHTESFQRWLKLNLEGQKADFDLFVSSLQSSSQTIVRTWIQIESYRCFVPASASPAERELFLSNVETLLRIELAEISWAATEGPQPPPGLAILNLKEASEMLRVPARTLRLWAELGEIPAVKAGRQWRFWRRDVEEWLVRQKNPRKNR
jgi:excisionase family DNA binding protein